VAELLVQLLPNKLHVGDDDRLLSGLDHLEGLLHALLENLVVDFDLLHKLLDS
jgi:hypothetical protein